MNKLDSSEDKFERTAREAKGVAETFYEQGVCSRSCGRVSLKRGRIGFSHTGLEKKGIGKS